MAAIAATSALAVALVAAGFAVGRTTTTAVAPTSRPAASPAPSWTSSTSPEGLLGVALVFGRAQVPSDRPEVRLPVAVVANSIRRLQERRSIGVTLYAALRSDGRIALLATTLQRKLVTAAVEPPQFAAHGLALRFTVTTDPIDDAGSGALTTVDAEWQPDGAVSITPTQR